MVLAYSHTDCGIATIPHLIIPAIIIRHWLPFRCLKQRRNYC